MKKSILFIGFLCCIIVLLLLTRITLVNSISTTGIKLIDLQNQIDSYRNENELLTVQYLQAASYTNLAMKAKKLGYVPVTAQIDLSAPIPLALQ